MGIPTVKKIKSAQRVMEVLEFFDARRREATVMDLVRVLDYPQSSASELLSCLVWLGYLSYDRHRRTYKPTVRVPLLGSWTLPALFRNGTLLAKMDALAEQTGEMVALANIDSFSIRYLHIVPSRTTASGIEVGSTHSPFRSALGRAIVSQWQDKLVQDVVRRLNAEEPVESRRLRSSEVIADVHDVAATGFAVSPNESGSCHGMVAITISGEPGLAVGLGCAASDIGDAAQRASLLIQAFSRNTDNTADAMRFASVVPPRPAFGALARAPSTHPQWQPVLYEGRRA
ncbi:MAG: IclR family transcriptional regulator [Sphingomonadales bacterium]|nr:IclR family transcriptional regulator [Sphingomonadales bacterium]